MNRLVLLTLSQSALGLWLTFAAAAAESAPWLSPNALAASPDGSALFVACATGQRVVVMDTQAGTIAASIAVPPNPSGLAVSADGRRLWVTCGNPAGLVAVVDTASKQVIARIPAGHTPNAPVVSKDGKTLYVCNRFNDDVSFLNLATNKETCRVKVEREPVAAALTRDGNFLLVANLLHQRPADADNVAAVLSVIDTAAAKVVKTLHLPNGSGSLNDVRISPGGKSAVITHILSRFNLPTTQLDRGWINTNAMTLVDIEHMEVLNTVLLDNVDQGAANPWAAAWTPDGKTLVITHAGTHEISIIDFPALLAKLASVPRETLAGHPADYASASRTTADVPNDLAFLVNVRRRLKLPAGDLGPRAVTMLGNLAYIANYFSDTLAVVDTATAYPKWQSFPLGTPPAMTAERQGEIYFNDAGICFQNWQSCASCHPGDARMDALNWDLPNDGIGNPKNNKSLLLVHRTPPSMSLGVRETAGEAVRAGIRHILFSVQPPAVGDALDAYLKALRPVPSPHLQQGVLSPAAERGKALFNDEATSCASCHPPGLFTDLQQYEVGTAGRCDKPNQKFDTPTLIESWRTAPYLHDGSAATIHDVITSHNRGDAHGKTANLTEPQRADLIEYVLSL